MNEPVIGSVCWNEFISRDSDSTAAFLAKLFGWVMEQSPLHEGYKIIMNKGSGIGGIMQMGTEFPKEAKGTSMPYVAVKDVDEMADFAKQYGGKVIVPPTDIPGVGRFCVITEPSGIAFSMITLLPPPPPPPQKSDDLTKTMC